MPISNVYTWTGGTAGVWTTAANWNRKKVPGETDTAVIGGADTVTVPYQPLMDLPSPTDPDGIGVGALELVKGAELIVAPGMNEGNYYNLASGYSPSTSTFSIEGVGLSVNAGTIFVSDGASLRLTGEIYNTGTISLNANPSASAQADLTNLVIVGKSSAGVSGGVVLSGGGTIVMSDSADNKINGTVLQSLSADVLTSDNTIEGAGYIGHLTFNNWGVVNADDSDLLGLYDDAIVNSGKLEATGAGILFIYDGTTVRNVWGGEIVSDTTGAVRLNDATIEDGTLTGGYFDLYGATTFDGASRLTIDKSATVYVDEQTLTLEGDIRNEGTISVGSTLMTEGEIAIDGFTRLGGGGSVDFNGDIVGAGSGAYLFVGHQTLSGEGAIGDGDKTLHLIVGRHGLIDATGALTLDTGNPLLNFGEIEATSGGSLTISDAVYNFSHSLSADGGDLTLDGAVHGGGLDISGATLEVGGVADGVAVDYLTGGGKLKLDDAPAFSGDIAGFGQTGNSIDLTDVAFNSSTTWSFTENAAGTEGVLKISDAASGGPTVSLHLLGDFSMANFSLGPDASHIVAAAVSSGGSGTTSNPAGTLISYQSQVIAS